MPVTQAKAKAPWRRPRARLGSSRAVKATEKVKNNLQTTGSRARRGCRKGDELADEEEDAADEGEKVADEEEKRRAPKKTKKQREQRCWRKKKPREEVGHGIKTSPSLSRPVWAEGSARK